MLSCFHHSIFMSEIEYPYMPEGRHLKYVPVDNHFMQHAALACNQCAGDPLYPVGIVLVKDGEVIARAGNGFNKGPGQVHVCPRIVHECPSGTGYELCNLHDSPGHSERMVVEEAKRLGVDVTGADAYMYGHWWACEPCWTALIDAGINDLYVTDDAHERFHRDKVYAKTLTSTVKTAYIAGPITHAEDFEASKTFYETVGEVCESMGISSVIPHRDNWCNESPDLGNSPAVFDWSVKQAEECDVTIAQVGEPSLGTGGELMAAYAAGKKIVLLSEKGRRVSRFVHGNPSVVYHIEYESHEMAMRQLKNVLKQL
jgi:deoxycytidylate deaminase